MASGPGFRELLGGSSPGIVLSLSELHLRIVRGLKENVILSVRMKWQRRLSNLFMEMGIMLHLCTGSWGPGLMAGQVPICATTRSLAWTKALVASHLFVLFSCGAGEVLQMSEGSRQCTHTPSTWKAGSAQAEPIEGHGRPWVLCAGNPVPLEAKHQLESSITSVSLHLVLLGERLLLLSS